jgi:hypothetical protein
MNPIVAHIPVLAEVPGRRMLDDAAQDEDCPASIDVGPAVGTIQPVSKLYQRTSRVIYLLKHNTTHDGQSESENTELNSSFIFVGVCIHRGFESDGFDRSREN